MHSVLDLLKTSNTYFTSPQLQIQVAVTSLWEQVSGWPDCASDCLAFEHSTLHAAQSFAKYWFVLNFWVLESIPFFTFKVEKKNEEKNEDWNLWQQEMTSVTWTDTMKKSGAFFFKMLLVNVSWVACIFGTTWVSPNLCTLPFWWAYNGHMLTIPWHCIPDYFTCTVLTW